MCAALRITPRPGEKIEDWCQTLKNRIPPDNDYLPGGLERQTAAFVQYYHHVRYHKSIDPPEPGCCFMRNAVEQPDFYQ